MALVAAFVEDPDGTEHTISIVRRPKATTLQVGEMPEAGYLPEAPGYGIVYNYNQTSEYYLDFDNTSRNIAPPPVNPQFSGLSTSSWGSAGQSRLRVEKTETGLIASVSQWSLDSYNQLNTIDVNTELEITFADHEFLDRFNNKKTKWGFASNRQIGKIKDFFIETDAPDNNIFDVQNLSLIHI